MAYSFKYGFRENLLLQKEVLKSEKNLQEYELENIFYELEKFFNLNFLELEEIKDEYYTGDVIKLLSKVKSRKIYFSQEYTRYNTLEEKRNCLLDNIKILLEIEDEKDSLTIE